MRIECTLAVVGTLFLAAGCADTQPQTPYGEPIHGGQAMSSSIYGTESTYPVTTATVDPPYSVQGGDFDRDVAERVRRELNRHDDLAAVTPTIQITAQNGAVILAGSVPTETQRHRIHSIARNTAGVLAVNDQLQIAAPPPVGYSPAPPSVYSSTYGQTDQALANQVQQNLYSHPVSSGFAQNIRVILQGGRVTLTGNVSSEQDRHVVDEVVRNTPGVVGVTDQMQVALVPTGRVQEQTR